MVNFVFNLLNLYTLDLFNSALSFVNYRLISIFFLSLASSDAHGNFSMLDCRLNGLDISNFSVFYHDVLTNIVFSTQRSR